MLKKVVLVFAQGPISASFFCPEESVIVELRYFVAVYVWEGGGVKRKVLATTMI